MTSASRSLIIRSLLAGAVLLAGAAVFYQARIAPARQRQIETEHEIADMRDRLNTAQKELWAIKEREQQNWRFRRALESLHQDSPVAPPLTWLPVRMKSRLAALGVTQAEVRLNMVEPEPRIVGFDRTYWHVTLSPQNAMRKMTDALLAAAQLEQQDRFVKILDFTFRTEANEYSETSGHVNVAAFVRR